MITSASIDSAVTVDWLKGVISAKENASVSIVKGTPVDSWEDTKISLNAARIDAYERARDKSKKEIINRLLTLKIDPENTMRDLLEKHVTMRNRLTEVLEDKIAYKEHPEGFYRSRCEGILALGDLFDALPFNFPGDEFPSRMDTPIETEYTSLIIDARGLTIKPMLLPSVYNAAGLEIYGKNFIDVAYAARYGMVSYVHTESEAMKNRKAGKHPYYTAALRNLRQCPVISERDTRKIFSSGKTLEHLKKCRVIFIIDREG